jgi:uncharacterized membrane protein
VTRRPSVVRAFTVRPHLLAALAAGAAAWFILALGPWGLRWSTSAALAWDLTCLLYMLISAPLMVGKSASQMRVKAASQDEGGGMILGLVILATAISLVAVGVELSMASGAHGPIKGLRIALAVITVVASWSMMQFVFALHYAHGYYAPEPGEGDPEGVAGGLAFPGGQEPDYWDFLHFAVIVGVAGQTADIAYTSKSLRRVGTLHAVAAYAFNTTVVALMINLIASLF